MRTIDADALKASLPEPTNITQRLVYKTLCDFIDNAPTVETPKIYEFKGCDNCELERPQGEWIMIKNSDGQLKCYECSECKKSQGYISNFCEDCGADMRGEEK